ncbi:hypothetical protein [Tatumella sp. UCD-D_suzukii]|uniref:Uncharacterized protein n=1 Tax=Tatumella terrea TaxID=419007 RepID=A0ABW1VY26_9GAMM|nr:hypothetical protein [Tatumella sp. UCD-D_suzukii]
MSNESLLSTMLDHDFFHGQDDKVSGIAMRAVDHGFDTLSVLQQRVLKPFMSQPCDGVTNPGGDHNGCESLIDGDDLETAIINQNYYGGLLCDKCINEKVGYIAHWEKIQAE